MNGKAEYPGGKPLAHEKTITTHPALDYFSQLQKENPSSELSQFLSSFNQQAEFARKELYKNAFCGLHYANDLADLWNEAHPGSDRLKLCDTQLIVPPGWEATLQDGSFQLTYRGKNQHKY